MAERGNIEIKVGTTFTSFDEAKTAIANFFKEQFHLVRPVKKQTVRAYNARGTKHRVLQHCVKKENGCPFKPNPQMAEF